MALSTAALVLAAAYYKNKNENENTLLSPLTTTAPM